MRRLRILLRRVESPQWDVVVRGSGVAALAGLVSVVIWPNAIPLLGFLIVTIFVNGPLAPLLPATYEPVLMVAGRLYHPVLVAAIGIAGTLYVEFLNYHLYSAALLHPRTEPARQSAIVQRIVRLFQRAPFFSVWLCAWSPLPFWAVRFLAPLSRYPVGRYLFATFLGRAPRLWFFAALGPFVPLPTVALVAVTVVMILFAVIVAVHRARRQPAGAEADVAPATAAPALGDPEAAAESA